MSSLSTDLSDGERRGVLSPQWADRDAFTVEEAGKILGISRASAFAAASRGDIPTIRIGKRLIVPRHGLEKLLGGDEGLRKAPEQASPATS
jgi:hypothetical protein